ncbi:MAG: hypothetical protein KQH67_05165 [Bacteroidetes bacterium]|nr:hypothetical protein [Bacteroidota bacterium]
MDCIFNICELINGILLGVTASLIATSIAFIIANWKNRKKLKRKFGKAEGKYFGYGYSKEEPDLKLKETPQSEAEIFYVKENILQIELTETPNKGKYKWGGIITMELENYGSIAWKYEIYNGEKLEGNKHKFGFKRLIIEEDEKFMYIYLADENLEGGEKYSKEVLIREK